MKILTPPTQKEEIEIFKNLLLIDPNVTFDGIVEEKVNRWNDEVEDIFDAYYENITDFTNKSLCIQEWLLYPTIEVLDIQNYFSFMNQTVNFIYLVL